MSTQINISKQIAIKDEGVIKTSNVNSVNFTGAGVTATNVGNDVTVNIPGGGGSQVGYRGFKYTVTEQYDGAEPNPTIGQAILWFQDDGEGGWYYSGIYISTLDADGTSLFNMFYNLLNSPQQPYVLVNSTGVISINEISSATFSGPYSKILLTNNNGAPNIGSSGGICYFHFQTTNAIPAYTGYTMAGNLNGTSIAAGTWYLGIGSSTAGSTIDSRSFYANTPQRRIMQGTIRTASTMTGSMSIRVIEETNPIGTEYVLPFGTAAGIYQFASYINLINIATTLSLRITQSGGPSCGINGFTFTLI